MVTGGNLLVGAFALVSLYAGYLAVIVGGELKDHRILPMITLSWIFFPAILSERGRVLRKRCLFVCAVGFLFVIPLLFVA